MAPLLSPLVFALLSACTPHDGTEDSGSAFVDGGADDGGTEDGGTQEVEPASWSLASPSLEAELLVGTRVDLLLDSGGLVPDTVTGIDASASCGLAGDWLHCALTPEHSGEVGLELTVGVHSARLIFTARQPEGLWPAGDHLPLGLYEVYSLSAMELAAASGFQLVQTYASTSYTHLEWQGWAAATGLYTLTDAKELADIVAYSHLPQVGWWDLPEEQRYWYEDELGLVQDLSTAIRDTDDRPVYMYIPGHYTADDIAHYVPYLDVVATGAYVEYSGMPHSWVRWRVEENRRGIEAAGHDPADLVNGALLQLFPAHGEPTPTTVRFDALAALAAGAQSVYWFGWWYAENVLDPEVGTAVLDTGALITGEGGLSMAIAHGERVGELAIEVLSGPTEATSFTPLYVEEPVVFDAIHAVAWDWLGTRWVVAVNGAEETVEATIAGLDPATAVEVLGEGRSLAATEGAITDSWEGLGAHVYRAPLEPRGSARPLPWGEKQGCQVALPEVPCFFP